MATNTNSPLRWVIPALAAAVLAFGAYSVGKSNSSSTNASAAFNPSGTAQAPQSGAQQQTPQAGTQGNQLPQAGQGPQAGQAPPGFGTPATGAGAAKAKAAALAKYPGSVEQVMALSDGSYVVHVITSNGELHVAVSKAFEVTGTEQGPRGAAGAIPQQQNAPQAGTTQQ